MKKDDFLEYISEKIKQSNEFKNTQKILSERGSVSLGGLGEVGKALLVGYIAQANIIPRYDLREYPEVGPRALQKTIFLSDNIENAKKIFEDWGIKNQLIKKQEKQKNKGIEEQKINLNTIFFNNDIVLSDYSDIFQKVVSLEEYKKRIIKIKVGDKLDLVELADLLTEIGYLRVKKPNSQGEFNIKGDIIDIFISEEKTRIEFFGNRVEKIVGAGLAPAQTKGRPQGSPLRELQINPIEIPEGDEFLISWFDNYTLIIDGQDSFQSHILTLFTDFDNEISQKEAEELKKIEDFVKKQKVIYLENFSVDEKKGVNLGWYESKKYNGNTAELLRDIKESQKSSLGGTRDRKIKNSIFIFSEKAEQIRKFLTNNGVNVGGKLGKIPRLDLREYPEVQPPVLPMVIIQDQKISEGVDFSSLGITVFSDKEIFGEPKRKKKRKVDFSALTNLKKGEYVVHIDHGIGIFTGFGEISVDGIKREYIFIEYDKGDKIFVPIDQADKITKYIAITNSPPHLSSLKTGQWLKIRKKVKENAEKIAKELIEAQALREGEKPFNYIDDSREQKILEKSFSYHETPDQAKTIREVLDDMEDKKPMDRLVCGDVGYGKTEVAIRAATKAVVSGGQVAILVPTTILAEQHLQTFQERLDQLGFRIKSLSRFVDSKKQKKVIDEVKNGSVDIIIGTHRLLSKDIKFKNLNLIIIDEEQKFGVKHKEKLKNLRSKTDILTMTATPIPRTLYLGLGGLKEISLIQTPPEGRLPIKTVVIKNDDEIIKDAINREIERGGQVYFVHNRVETIVPFTSRLKKLLPKVSFVIGHGQMDERKLAEIMNDFAKGKYQVLVCSTIIESGLDISSVNTLIVDKATRFGLSQLHQLRGRIGRSHRQAYAYFLYNAEDLKGNAQRRLQAISEKEALGSGYELSLEDLDIRGSGNILGEEQHGNMQMVGVGYYLRLLEEAVENIKSQNSSLGGTRDRQVKNNESLRDDIKIDLPISTYIPDGFYKKEEDKIKAYQLIAGFDEMDDVVDFENNLIKLGEIPQEYKNLINIVKIKIKANKAGIKSILAKDVLGVGERKTKKIYIEFDHILSRQEVGKIFALNKDWYFGNTLARIDLEKLGEDWFKKIALTVENVSK